MPPTRALLRLVVFCAVGLGIIGCGGSAPVVPPTNPGNGASTMGGNWLLVGSLPPLFPPLTPAPTDFALSVDVEGNALVGLITLETNCSSGGASGQDFLGELQGTVAADGTFALTLQPADPGISLSVTGTVPATEGTGWAGKYSYSDTTSPTCTLSASGAFQATPVANVEGTYSGQGPITDFQGALSPAPSPGTVYGFTETLQQGAPIPPSTVTSAIGLSGSIQTTGFPCFSKGQMSTTLGSIVNGSEVAPIFTMDDGSSLSLLGTISNTASSMLTLSVAQVTGGKCAGIYLYDPSPLVLARGA